MDSNNQYIIGELCRFYALESGFAESPVMSAHIWLNLWIHLQQNIICVI